MPRAKRAAHEVVPPTMLAAAIDRFGGPSVLKLHELPTVPCGGWLKHGHVIGRVVLAVRRGENWT